jgi:hypothetical protein
MTTTGDEADRDRPRRPDPTMVSNAMAVDYTRRRPESAGDGRPSRRALSGPAAGITAQSLAEELPVLNAIRRARRPRHPRARSPILEELGIGTSSPAGITVPDGHPCVNDNSSHPGPCCYNPCRMWPAYPSDLWFAGLRFAIQAALVVSGHTGKEPVGNAMGAVQLCSPSPSH